MTGFSLQQRCTTEMVEDLDQDQANKAASETEAETKTRQGCMIEYILYIYIYIYTINHTLCISSGTFLSYSSYIYEVSLQSISVSISS